MKGIFIVLFFLSSTISIYSQTYRFDTILAKHNDNIEAKKTASNIFISTTKKSVIKSSNYFFKSSFENFLELNLVNSIQESDYIFDCTISGKSESARAMISIYNSKTGEFLATTGKFSSINWEIALWGAFSYGSKYNHFQNSFENCVATAILPIFNVLNGNFKDNPIIVKGTNHVVNVVVVRSEKYVAGFEKIKDISVRLSKGKSPEDIQKKLEQAMERLRLTASTSYSPIVLITETFGLGGVEKVGYNAVCYRYKKQ